MYESRSRPLDEALRDEAARDPKLKQTLNHSEVYFALLGRLNEEVDRFIEQSGLPPAKAKELIVERMGWLHVNPGLEVAEETLRMRRLRAVWRLDALLKGERDALFPTLQCLAAALGKRLVVSLQDVSDEKSAEDSPKE